MNDLPKLPNATEDDRLGIPSTNGDPMKFLEQVMDSPKVSLRARMQAATSLLQYKYARIGETGKKEKQNDAAKGAAAGAFKSRPAPAALPKH